MHNAPARQAILTLLAVFCMAIVSGCAGETATISKSTQEYLKENLPQTSE